MLWLTGALLDSKSKLSQNDLNNAAEEKKRLQAALLMANSKRDDAEERLTRLLEEEKTAHQNDIDAFNNKQIQLQNLLNDEKQEQEKLKLSD